MHSHSLLSKQWTLKEFIALYGNDYPLLQRFCDTEQDPQWHSEGDVEVHTEMVLQETYRLIEDTLAHWRDDDKVTLLLAAIFHDYAKPICTTKRIINDVERTVAPKHESVGASLLMHCTPPFNLTSSQWRDVISLTAYHHIPKLLVVKEADYPPYFRLSRQVPSLEMLYYLEVADMRGRECDDKAKQLEIMELFRLFAEDAKCFSSWEYKDLSKQIALTFNTSSLPGEMAGLAQRVQDTAMIHLEEGRIYAMEEELSIAFNYLEQSHVIVLCGVAGSGKSTWVERLPSSFERIELDSIRETLKAGRESQSDNDAVLRTAMDKLRNALREKRHVVWDATGYRRDFRSRVINLAVAYGAYTEIVAFQCDKQTLLQRNKFRKHPVPENILTDMIAKYQWPEVGEAHRLTWIDSE